MFKMSGNFRGNPGTDLDPCLDVIPRRLQTVKCWMCFMHTAKNISDAI